MKQLKSYKEEFRQVVLESYDKLKVGSFLHIWDLIYDYGRGNDVSEKLMKIINNNYGGEKAKSLFDLSLKYLQKEKEARRFYMVSGTLQYGYHVIDREGYKLLYKSSNKENCERVLYIIGNNLNEEYPSTENDVYPTRILKFKGKHSTDYFVVNTLDQFKKVSMKYLLENHDQYEPNSLKDVKNYGGMTEEEIMSLPLGQIRTDAIKLISRDKEINVRGREEIRNWEILQKIKETGNVDRINELTGLLDYNFEYELIDPINK